MASINKVILIGNLGSDPEIKTVGNGIIAKISLATNETWNDKNTGEKKSRAEFHRIVFFNRLAGVVEQYLKKGDKVYVEGEIRNNKWVDKDGQKKYGTEIIAKDLKMLGGSLQQPQDNQGFTNENAPF